jgi:hypothetical protein
MKLPLNTARYHFSNQSTRDERENSRVRGEALAYIYVSATPVNGMLLVLIKPQPKVGSGVCNLNNPAGIESR